MKKFIYQGKLFKEARLQKGYTQRGLAEAIGDVHSQFVSNWERGLCGVPKEEFPKAVRILGIKKNQIIDSMMLDAKAEIISLCKNL